MDKHVKISTLNDLRAQLEKEVQKEEKDMVLIDKLRGKIVQLGLTLTTRDIIYNRYG